MAGILPERFGRLEFRRIKIFPSPLGVDSEPSETVHLRFFILSTLCLVASLTWLGKKLNLPYPTLQLFGGIMLGIWTVLPRFQLDPEIALYLLFPPLLFCAGWFTSWSDFRQHFRSISMLAIGLVLLTTVAVGVVAHLIVPGLSWPVAFLLGAFVSPTDPVAATNIAKRSGVSARVVNILEGESWVNDATGLVLYRIAISAVLTESFSLAHAGMQFIVSLGGGAIIGIFTGFLVSQVSQIGPDSRVKITLYLLAAYTAYFVADGMQTSGIVASCVAGLYLAQIPSEKNSEEHGKASSFLGTIHFLLSSSLFVLLGLQLP
jgi:CPA1 family monovalent cation:H+ antiporter